MLSRYLMTKASPPIPPLRLVLLTNAIAEACLVLCYSLPAHALRRWQHRQRGDKLQADALTTDGRKGSVSLTHKPSASAQGLPPQKQQQLELTTRLDENASTVVGGLELQAAPVQRPLTPQPMQHSARTGLYAPEQVHRRDSTQRLATAQQVQVRFGSGDVPAVQRQAEGLPAASLLEEQQQQVQQQVYQHGQQQQQQGQHLQEQEQQQRHRHQHPSQAVEGQPPAYDPEACLRPDVPMRRGLSRRFDRLHAHRPGWYLGLTVATLTLSFLGVYAFQAVAPGYVDPSLPQLVIQFSVVCVALVQALLLRARLPLYTWPCAGAMVAGAAMVIVPNLSQASCSSAWNSTTGSLNTGRGWLGFGFALASLVSSVIYLVVIQATSHLRLSSELLNHAFFLSGALLFLPLSLAIEGTGWAGQLGPWTGEDWVLLAVLSVICYLGSATAIQILHLLAGVRAVDGRAAAAPGTHCVWQLGAPTTAMFFCLRLILTVALSPSILGATIIQTGVQIAGVAITAVALTVYMGFQWRRSRQQAQAPSTVSSTGTTQTVDE
ncbi:hypothetical protein N2152v2_003371 [Parachlorella kessleri]